MSLCIHLHLIVQQGNQFKRYWHNVYTVNIRCGFNFCKIGNVQVCIYPRLHV